MKNKLRAPFLFTLIILPIAVAAGVFTGIYLFEAYAPEVQAQLLSQVGSYGAFLLVTTLQSAIFASVCSFFGYILADKTGLLRSFSFEKKKLGRVLIITAVCGVLFSLDYWTFARAIPQVASSYSNLVTPANFLASVLYGGIIEEVLMRLFLMSLVSFVIWKLFFRRVEKKDIPDGVFTAANIITAIAFAAGHLPTTVTLFGTLTPLIVLRCFLINGGVGLVFGRIYRRYGIQYAMLGHAGCHIISKMIWIIFI